jgi:hypothetical protein
MSMEVNKMVEQYVAMTEEKSKANFSMSWSIKFVIIQFIIYFELFYYKN